MHTAHVINYADPAIKGDGAKSCRTEIVRFVRGIRRPRQAPVTAKQIINWMRATPAEFVQEQIDEAILLGKIAIRQKSLSSGRRFNGSYVYEIMQELSA